MLDSHMKHEKVPLTERLKSVVGIFGLHWGPAPHYQIVYSEGDMELRRYDPICVAQTPMHKDAFMKLADYIFGRNHRNEKMEMTVPVFQDVDAGSRMSPQLHKSHKAGPMLSFILPLDMHSTQFPEPLDRDVHVQKLGPQVVATLSFSGTAEPARITENAEKLLAWMETLHVIADHVRLAHYDGPMTIPFLRKNEIQIVVKSVH